MINELEKAYAIVKEVKPSSKPDLCCVHVAAAIAGMRGLKMKQIRIGAFYHKTKFNDADPYICMRGGWGLEGVDPTTGKIFLAEDKMFDDGSFNGHTWLEPAPGTVLDLMHDAVDIKRREIDEHWNTVGLYHPLPVMEKQVKSFHRKTMTACMKLGSMQNAL